MPPEAPVPDAPILAPLLLRPIRADDLDRLRNFVRHLSPRTGYQRLLSSRIPTEKELRCWTALDRSREGALVATMVHGGETRILGVARYVREASGGDAEMAVVLADAWQGRGLGTELLRALVDMARVDGVQRLTGTTLSTNAAAIALVRRVGFRTRRDPASAVFTLVDLELAPTLPLLPARPAPAALTPA